MKVVDDREPDALVFTRREELIRESDEVGVRPGVIADFGEDGGVARFTAQRSARDVEDADGVQFATTVFKEARNSTWSTPSRTHIIRGSNSKG